MRLCAPKDAVLCVKRSPYTDLGLAAHFTLYGLKLILVFIKPLLNQGEEKASVWNSFLTVLIHLLEIIGTRGTGAWA